MTNNFLDMPRLPVSWGEVFDKLTILRIKTKRILDPQKHKNIEREIQEIERVIGDFSSFPAYVHDLVVQLESVNTEIWNIEEGKRQAEHVQLFDDHFIQLARQVYIKNDQRAFIKRAISLHLGGALLEEKSHLTLTDLAPF